MERQVRRMYVILRRKHIAAALCSALALVLVPLGLAQLPGDLSKYDRIYLGYPNYCGTMPMAVYTFLEQGDFSGKTICPFCTHEGSGLCRTEREIAAAAKGAAVTEGLAIHGSHVDEAGPALKNWVKKLG